MTKPFCIIFFLANSIFSLYKNKKKKTLFSFFIFFTLFSKKIYAFQQVHFLSVFVLPFLVVFSVKVFNKVKRRTFLTVFPEEFDRKNTAVKKSNIYTITQSTIVMRNRNKQLN